MKKDMYYVGAEDLIPGVDFKVVTDTPFNAEQVNHFYEFEGHLIDYELVSLLGLGVVENLHLDDDYYIYNASNDNLDNSFGFINEVIRLGVYYQITHPNYDDKDLEKTILITKGGKEYLRKLQTEESDVLFDKLKQIFNSKKGNVIQLNK